MKYFIANWKANKNLQEALAWIDQFMSFDLPIDNEKVVIICPPLPFIYPLKQKIESNLRIKFGAQDISQFEDGKYTGEVTAKSLSGLIDYVIIGHSERRRYFNEQDSVLESKLTMAQKYELQSIFCVRNETDKIPKNVKIVAYEPVGSIGTGVSEDVGKILEIKKKINLLSGTRFLYGGSVNPNNVGLYLQSGQIDGFLISTSSLDPKDFFDLLTTDSTI